MDPTVDTWLGLVRWAPTALIGVGVVFDLVTPIQYSGGPLVAVACVAAGATLPLRRTVAVAAAMVVAILWWTFRQGTFGPLHGGVEAGNVIIGALVGLEVNRMISRYGQRLAVVSTVAEAAQRALLPDPPSRLGPLSVAARYRAAQSEARIGGDAYAVEETPYGIRLLIADVRGKGLEAVRAVSVLLGAFREAAEQAADLVELAGRLEHALLREARRHEGEERVEGFATALVGELDLEGGAVRLLNRGHPSPYLLHEDGAVRTLEATEPDLPLRMGALDARRSAADTFPFPADATLLLVTDGVTEARDRAGSFYDPALRLAGLGPFEEPRRTIDVLVRDVDAWTGERHADDMAVLALSRTRTSESVGM
ncbi:PP2C family protein-serine/threonine phosphatase [Streptantibioticus rubrisoli]|uniref:Serine/threonine-protein phosphatase n=1 Tax=Streptantibioticus rubrisoli TaxID=1387313 RepID=A0ABT1PAI8_9ACTN|nr:PP2C family protein-serine/threonine phosphatase [Streptantibioticus rubrisoli]MCQ4041340.1 serine/threonine-protein phosphatase [Streptantibioticus rubrisoli]